MEGHHLPIGVGLSALAARKMSSKGMCILSSLRELFSRSKAGGIASRPNLSEEVHGYLCKCSLLIISFSESLLK